jgi:hypothetical protein
MVTWKLKRLAENTEISLQAALGGEEAAAIHLRNLKTAAEYIQTMPNHELRAATKAEGAGHYIYPGIVDGTVSFRIKNRILDRASPTLNLKYEDIEETIMVLRAANYLQKKRK